MATLNLHNWGRLCTTIFAGRIGRWWIVYFIVCIWFATYQEFHSWKVQGFSAGMDFLKASGPINSQLNHHLENHCNWYRTKSAKFKYICIYILHVQLLRGYMPEKFALLIWGSGFGALGSPRLSLYQRPQRFCEKHTKGSECPEESHDPITGWWFGTFFIFPFHIWDVILPIDFHSIIFQAVFGLAPGIPVRPRYDLYGARQTMLLSTASLAFCGLVRCLPLRGQGFMVLVQLSMRAGGLEQMSCLRWKIYVKSVVFVGNLYWKSWKNLPKRHLDVEENISSDLLGNDERSFGHVLRLLALIHISWKNQGFS